MRFETATWPSWGRTSHHPHEKLWLRSVLGSWPAHKVARPGPGGLESAAGWLPRRELSPRPRAGRSQRMGSVSQATRTPKSEDSDSAWYRLRKEMNST